MANYRVLDASNAKEGFEVSSTGVLNLKKIPELTATEILDICSPDET